MLPSCQTDIALVLLGVSDEKGVLRFPKSDGAKIPGIHFAVKPLLAINPQISEAISSHFGVELGVHLTIEQNFFDATNGDDGAVVSIYLATLAQTAPITYQTSWPTMPDLLRQLSGRDRLPFLRAWQVFAGGLTLDTKALEKSLAEIRELAKT